MKRSTTRSNAGSAMATMGIRNTKTKNVSNKTIKKEAKIAPNPSHIDRNQELENARRNCGLEVIILAAGKGTRMKSDLPKVLHKVCGVPMVELLLRQVDAEAILWNRAVINLVVGHGKEFVQGHVESLVKKGVIQTPVIFSHQQEQLGTAHAVQVALVQGTDHFSPSIEAITLVLNGDLPLYEKSDVQHLISSHLKNKSVATLASMDLKEGGAYGRILRSPKGQFQGIVEFKDANNRQRKISEVNGGVYAFSRQFLQKAISKVNPSPVSGEYYLPEVFSIAMRQKQRMTAEMLSDLTPLTGVNNLLELAEAQTMLFRRTAHKHILNGVSFYDATNVYIGPLITIQPGAQIGPGVILEGESTIGTGAKVGGYCYINDSDIADHAILKQGSFVDRSKIGSFSSVGPMAQLRPGSKLGSKVKVGNFVELKDTVVGDNTSISHLSYLGDAQVGKRVNIGCGFVTCNYDGVERNGLRKHPSVISDDCFIGSDCQVVAPIELAEGTFVASGSTVTETITEKDCLVVARVRQIVKPGYAKRYRQSK